MESKSIGGIQLNEAIAKLSPKAQKGVVIIYTHDIIMFAYQPELESMVYRVNDERLYDTDGLWEDEDKFRRYADLIIDLFVTALNSGKQVIEIPFSSFIASVLESFLPILQTYKGFKFLAASFFHSDRQTEALFPGEAQKALDRKVVLIDAMLLYSHIKKIEIPLGALFSETRLTRLIFEE